MDLDISQRTIRWFREILLDWGPSNFSKFIWRSCKVPILQLLVEILLQRTKAEQVEPIFIELLEHYPDIESLSSLSEDDIARIIHPLGLHWRAPLIYKLVQKLKNDFKGTIPEDLEQLQELPAIGHYISSSYLSLHRNKRAYIIDSNVVRIYGRFFGFEYDGETRRKKWLKELANKITPQIDFREFNYALLDLAKSICKIKPLCMSCALFSGCKFRKTSMNGTFRL